MAYLTVDEEGQECIHEMKPERFRGEWYTELTDFYNESTGTYLPKGSIEKLAGKVITWDNEPIETT